VDTVSLEVRSSETWQQTNGGTSGGHQGGEPGQDLRQAIAIPDRICPIHGWSNQEGTPGHRLPKPGERVTKLGDDALDPLARVRVLLGVGEEVGHAGHDEDVMVGGHLAKTLVKDGEVAAGDELRGSETWTGAPIHVVDVAPDVGVADQGITSLPRHPTLSFFRPISLVKISFM